MTRTTLYLFSSSLLLLVLACLSNGLTAQRTTIVLSQEIEVPEGIAISSVGPTSVRINGRGIINSRHLQDKYVVSGREALPHVFIINKTMAINSWRHNTIKQVVTLVVETENSRQLADLRKALHADLTLSPTNEIQLNYALNITQFTLNNGWFQEERNSITLTDGKAYPVKSLEIKNEVFLPENAALNFNLTQTSLSLGDHQGTIELTMNGGEFSAGCLRHLDANLTDASIKIDAIDDADITTINSQLKLGLVAELELSSSLSTGQVDSTGLLKLAKTLSDNLTFSKVSTGTVHQAVFSSLTINLLKTSLQYSGKSAHLKIIRAGHALRSFHSSSQDGSISFPLPDLPAAYLECSNIKGNRFFFPTNIPGPEKGITTYDYQWGDPENTASIKLGGRRCEFYLDAEARPK